MRAADSSEGGARSAPPERADARRNRARILAAAEEVFAEHGRAGSTEEVARRAGVAIGTVFRHYPTKHALLEAIMKGLLDRLRHDAEQHATQGDPSTALFTFFTDLVHQAAAKRSVIGLLADAGTDVPVDAPVRGLGAAIAAMLERAQAHEAIRGDVTADDVLALLVSTAQGALRAEWTPEVQSRVLRIVFDGLAARPTPATSAQSGGTPTPPADQGADVVGGSLRTTSAP